MAKKNKTLIKLVSSAGTGVFLVRRKNPKTPGKISLKKYDQVARAHVLFNETKLK